MSQPTMREESAIAPPHILLVSFPGQGHVNPLLRLGKRLAAKGALVTFSSTLTIGGQLLSSSKTPADTPIPVGSGHLRFEFFSDGWEAGDPRRSGPAYMPQLQSACPAAVAALIRRQAEAGRPVSCVVNNPFVPWVLDVAESLNVPSAVLWVQSCAVFSAYYHYFHSLSPFPSDDDPDAAVSLPGMPPLRADELPTFLLPSNPYTSLTDAILAQFKNLGKATWVLANSFEELEPDVIRSISVIPVGPLVDDPGSGIRGDLLEAEDDCMGWLDAQEPGSVVYVSLGSIVVLTADETAEMAGGLVGCGRPFLWVARDGPPAGLADEVGGRGVAVRWAPQERVLGHGAVGCFLTHCGWNSTLEALAAGVPVVAYPQWGDQVPDAKFVAEVYGVGVRLPAPVRRGEVVRCVDAAMEGAEAERMKGRALGWREAAMRAVAGGGSSDVNIQAFVDELMRRVGPGEARPGS